MLVTRVLRAGPVPFRSLHWAEGRTTVPTVPCAEPRSGPTRPGSMQTAIPHASSLPRDAPSPASDRNSRRDPGEPGSPGPAAAGASRCGRRVQRMPRIPQCGSSGSVPRAWHAAAAAVGPTGPGRILPLGAAAAGGIRPQCTARRTDSISLTSPAGRPCPAGPAPGPPPRHLQPALAWGWAPHRQRPWALGRRRTGLGTAACRDMGCWASQRRGAVHGTAAR